MDGIKLSVKNFEKYIIGTDDHIWFGILKRSYWDKKNTLSEWRQIIAELKTKPAK